MIAEPKQTPNRGARAETKRERLLEAATRCIGRLGFAKSTMEEIALEAGVTRITIYREFGNREALVEALISRRLAAFNENFASSNGPFRDLASVLEDYLLVSANTARDNPITRELVRGSMSFTTLGSPHHAISTLMWRPWLEQARDAGHISPAMSFNEAITWILVIQYTLSRLVIDTDPTERHLRKLIRSFILPAFRGHGRSSQALSPPAP